MTSSPAHPPPTSAMSLSARCAEDLIAAAPVVLGFHPTDSVVMLTSDGNRPFHARVDLPARSAPPAAATGVADQLLGAARSNGVRSLALVFFSDDERAVRRVWGAVRRRCHERRLHVVDAVRADGRRYYPLLGDQRSREVGVPYDVDAHRFAAEAVLHGIVVERDRDAVVASVAPDPRARTAVEAAIARAELVGEGPPLTGADRRRWGEWLRRVVGRHVRRGSTASDDEVARIAWVVQDLRLRDAAWALLRRADADRHRVFWLDVVRRVPDALVPAPAALLGWAAWQSGHGALAWIAVDRCREVAPGYGMAAILARCLEDAVSPDSVECEFAWDEGLPA